MSRRAIFTILGSLLAIAALVYVVVVHLVDETPAPASGGWCCLNGEVFASTEPECLEGGGHFFATQEEAEEYCRGGLEQPSISDLKGPDWTRYVGTVVTVEGIFVRDPLPMLVTNLDLVRVNMPVPVSISEQRNKPESSKHILAV